MIKTSIIIITFILFSLSAKAEDTTSTAPKHVAGITAGMQYRMPKFLQGRYEQFGSNIFYRHLGTSDSPTGLLYASSLFAKTLKCKLIIGSHCKKQWHNSQTSWAVTQQRESGQYKFGRHKTIHLYDCWLCSPAI